MRKLNLTQKSIFLIMTLAFVSPALSFDLPKEITPEALMAETANKMRVIFGTSTFEPVGGTVSKRLTDGDAWKSDDIVSYTLVCIEKTKSGCTQYALFHEITLNKGKYPAKSYELGRIYGSDLQQFSDEQIETHKNIIASKVDSKYSSVYVLATEPTFNFAYSLGRPGMLLIPFVIAGAAFDLAKSPVVGIFHFGEETIKKASGTREVNDIMNFLTDASKQGALLDISHESYNRYFNLRVMRPEGTSESVYTTLFEIHNRFFSHNEYYEYLRFLEKSAHP